jgi:hypothetical protein
MTRGTISPEISFLGKSTPFWRWHRAYIILVWHSPAYSRFLGRCFDSLNLILLLEWDKRMRENHDKEARILPSFKADHAF